MLCPFSNGPVNLPIVFTGATPSRSAERDLSGGEGFEPGAGLSRISKLLIQCAGLSPVILQNPRIWHRSPTDASAEEIDEVTRRLSREGGPYFQLQE